MPELPEVETTRRGLEAHLAGQHIDRAFLRQPRLRWPVPKGLPRMLSGRLIQTVERRGKYLIFRLDTGNLLIHLGMSGSLRLVDPGQLPRKHDHFDLVLESGQTMRFHDPRRFGAILWVESDPMAHPLLQHLGPEPLSPGFNVNYMYHLAQGRRQSIKPLIMSGNVVVGIGNIYANEALFRAGIHPARAAGRISLLRYGCLISEIQAVLTEAISAGGTTLQDFLKVDGRPGYFRQELQVYGRTGKACPRCEGSLRRSVIAQRSTFYCPVCQR